MFLIYLIFDNFQPSDKYFRPECKEQTNGFSNAKHQSFNTKFEAYTFLTSDSVFNLESNLIYSL